MGNYGSFQFMGRKKGYKAPEGLVKQKHSSYWYIKTRINGKLIYKSTRTSDLQKAELILAKVKVALLSLDSQVKQIIGKSIPFRELMERYTKEVTPLKRSSRSDLINQIPLLQYFGDKPIDTITTQDAYKYMDWRKSQTVKDGNRPISGPTVNREISLLSHSFKKAIRWGYVSENPIKGIERFSENKRERYITDEEFEKIILQANSRRESRHLVDIMLVDYLTSGQRKGNILGLKWTQINLEDREITFEQVSKNKIVPEKIKISETLFRILKRLKGERSLKKVVGTYVFQKDDGTRFKDIDTTWNTCCRRAGVKDAHFHDIRHKAITDLDNLKIPLTHIGKAVGHRNQATTQRYSHLKADATREVMDALGKREFIQNCCGVEPTEKGSEGLERNG